MNASPLPHEPSATARPAAGILELKDVAVPALKDPDRLVLEGIHWTVAPGDFWAIGGRHASGKSDFIAVAAGVLPPARGTVKVFDCPPARGSEQQRMAMRQRLGVVFPNGLLLNHLTLADNISLPIRYHQNRRPSHCAARVNALLELTGLRRWADAYPGHVAAHRVRRAGLARALALNPELLLLDSPLTGLDPPDTAWWLELLDHLAAGHPLTDGRALTLVVTGDDLRPWRGHARQFAMLQNGRFNDLTHHPEAMQNPDVLLAELHGTTEEIDD